MPDCADSARPSPERRLRNVAAILAAGVLRLRQRPDLATENAEKNSSEVSTDGLELSPETRLSVRVVSNL